ncbi:maleylpyruvate isomerase family mycothiol-dependent enzyme [Streptomyces sp. H10-C2]|uniref:maleylpyruvate isomerase family mycothiol-dependent enzyme n=1 Tax=unclassified Streptomyces TaxID=2593676 RepID=UPI0024BB745E|nr:MULTISPECIES: maleylpyruvate isomerase family mycothiol-dependent enzyme [unclassified Streptomyces]MDJ0345424.1 maleylpyruvate isomerase family mycothiol-dependent enzyme [Streptomyces sp. PH10-H1]MDJ0374312.1 maleylpyruvate isomerase family mycothiol-dependent enzyme [Streptomyces sp. H10-C2]
MSVQRPDPALDAAAVHTATERLIEAVAALTASAVAEPSLLPGWTRGHVLTHLARNADSLVNLLTWARTGEEIPQYASTEIRDKDIEDGANRPLSEHLDDLRISADRFAMAVQVTPSRAWASQVRMRSGKVIAAAEIPWRRLVEINFHHVDLGIGIGFDDLPADFTGRQLDALLDSLSGHEGVAAVRLHDTGSGSTWDLGAANAPELTVSGTGNALLAWVSGRAKGEGLATNPDHPLPVLPPLI